MAENNVIPRAVSGFCPWATATLVITPAPRQATASWVIRAPRDWGEGSGNTAEIRWTGRDRKGVPVRRLARPRRLLPSVGVLHDRLHQQPLRRTRSGHRPQHPPGNRSRGGSRRSRSPPARGWASGLTETAAPGVHSRPLQAWDPDADGAEGSVNREWLCSTTRLVSALLSTRNRLQVATDSGSDQWIGQWMRWPP